MLTFVSLSLVSCQQDPNVKKLVPSAQAKPEKLQTTKITKHIPPPRQLATLSASSALEDTPKIQEKIILIPPPEIANKISVGLLLPLSGPRSELGRLLLDAAQLALFEVADKNFVLLPRDTKGTIAGARTAAHSAIEAGARLLLGPIFGPAALAVAPIAREARLNMVTFTNNRAAAGEGAFVMGFLPGQRIQRVVAYAAKRGVKRFAALLPTGLYGDSARQAFIDAVAKVGMTVVRVERYDVAPQSASEAVKRIGKYYFRRAALRQKRNSLYGKYDAGSRQALNRLLKLETLGDVDFDAVLLLETGEALKAIAPLLPYYDIDVRRVRVLGIEDWSSRSIRREPALAGAWYANSPREPAIKFATRFKKIYAQRPHALSSLAYDATAMAAILSARVGKSNFDLAALTAPNGFVGSAGLFRLWPNGLVEHQFEVFEVQPDQNLVLSNAPQSFGTVVN